VTSNLTLEQQSASDERTMSSSTYSTPESAIVAAGVGATLLLARLSFDLIVTVAERDDDKKKKKEDGEKNAGANRQPSTTMYNGRLSTVGGTVSDTTSSNGPASRNGSMWKSFSRKSKRFSASQEHAPSSIDAESKLEVEDGNQHRTGGSDVDPNHVPASSEKQDWSGPQRLIPLFSLMIHTCVCIYFLVACILSATGVVASYASAIYNAIPLGCTAAASFFNVVYCIRDFDRLRFSRLQRLLYTFSSLVLLLGIIVLLGFTSGSKTPTGADWVSLVLLFFNAFVALSEAKLVPEMKIDKGGKESDTQKKARLDKKAILTILKPYFWPEATSSSAILNRARAMTTWLCVALAKSCNLTAPILIGKASTALARGNYDEAIRFTCFFALVQLGASFFKEAQSLVYLRVAQAAFVQLSEVSFKHLHELSLDWHLKKKLGEVIRSMDRGILACDTLMKFLFLWLVPAMLECLLVVVIFATYFDYFPLSVSVFFYVFVYMNMTIVMTLWRKKFRKQVAKSDNDWHDRCTDSLVNFETVKFFTAEDYEIERFSKSVQQYQSGSVNVQASLSILNVSQNFLMQACLATSLSLAAIAVRDRSNCCVAQGCLDGSTSECCAAISHDICPGMEVGDFVSVLSYTINLFMPLNFLGSVYNAIIMALVDLTNLSELLAEDPDVVDAPDAITLPPLTKGIAGSDDDNVVVFDNVSFAYPSQKGGSRGLEGLSFKMKRGTVTAVVGTTGAGKTTLSRLLFRFYDVTGGEIRVNGKDVRQVTQKSLREAIGVVPQNTTLFNDTIRANILYGRRDATQEELERVCKAAQLDSFISTLPEGYESMVGDRGLKLSGGEKQRVSIARCLLKDPPIVLLDEATSALDTITEKSVQEALDSLGDQRTCFVIAHRLGTIKNADNIIVLGDGKVAEEGTHEELLALGGKYAEMWNMQLHSTRDSTTSLTSVGLQT
jgi:ABC-type transport system involved in Fe-S cluster assembly fused permease/ATPase subunit